MKLKNQKDASAPTKADFDNLTQDQKKLVEEVKDMKDPFTRMNIDEVDFSWKNATDLVDRLVNFPTMKFFTPS